MYQHSNKPEWAMVIPATAMMLAIGAVAFGCWTTAVSGAECGTSGPRGVLDCSNSSITCPTTAKYYYQSVAIRQCSQLGTTGEHICENTGGSVCPIITEYECVGDGCETRIKHFVDPAPQECCDSAELSGGSCDIPVSD